MRVAALYDIHGNIDALEAILQEVESEGIDLVLIGGDVAWGPFPSEVVARLRALDALWVRGNTDREVAAPPEEDSEDEIAQATAWCAQQLDTEQSRFLGQLPQTAVVTLDGLGEVLFCHGTPRSDEEIVTAITPDDDVAAVLSDVKQSLIVCGHTHSQFDRTIAARRLVNAGSVGLPYESAPAAYWTLFGPEVIPKRTEYDVARAADRARESRFPGAEWFADSITSPLSSAEAAKSFESRRAKT